MDEVVDLAYQILNCNISIKELEKKDKSTKVKLIELLEDMNIPEKLLLNKKLIEEEMNLSDQFHLSEFLEKPDFDYQYPYPCPFNKKTHKAALGFIYDNKSIYCNVPLNASHLEVFMELHKRNNPNDNNMLLFEQNHKGWQNVLMEKEHVIIIYFLPNDYGAVFFIPSDITSYQIQELEKMNELLKKKNIICETNKYNVKLPIYLSVMKYQNQLKTYIKRKNRKGEIIYGSESNIKF